mgnify:FL=1
MKKTSAILNLVLVVMVVLSGFPAVTRSPDLNHDDRIDLGETIIEVRHFSRSADRPDQFSQSMEDVLTSLQVVAGLKQVIKSKGSTQTTPSQNFIMVYMVSDHDLTVPMDKHPNINETGLMPASITGVPETPPPRIA